MISQEVVSRIVKKHTGENTLRTSPIVGKGKTNKIFLVETKSRKLIARLNTDETSTARFEKEAWCMKQASACGVLTSAVETVGRFDGGVYMLMPCIEGVNGEDTPEDDLKIWRALGTYARQIHNIAVNGFGENMTAPGHFDGNWGTFLAGNIESLSDARYANFLEEKELAILCNTLTTLEKTTFIFGLAHNDLSRNNTLVAPEGEVYLLDWGSAEAHIVPHMDIGELLKTSLKPESDAFQVFLDAYGMARGTFDDIHMDIRRLRILTHFDKLRWAIDRRPDLVAKYSTRLKDGLSCYPTLG
jgi:aminoglycoside phosphotransferase (APT) family kinase protein